jgi:Glycosyl hydrolases family 16
MTPATTPSRIRVAVLRLRSALLRRVLLGLLVASPFFLAALSGCGSGGGSFNPPPAPSSSISGTITNGAGASVALTGTKSATTIADSSGNFTFTGLANGAYTLTPSKAGLSFNPPSQPVTVNGSSIVGINFTASPQPTFSISGAISPVTGGSGAAVALSGTAAASVTASASGGYSFAGLVNGNYVVAPSNTGFVFTPATEPVTVNNASVINVDFTASPAPPPTFSISGTITPASIGSGSTVTLTGQTSASTTANASGFFSFTGLSNGSYTVAPSATGVTYTPVSLPVTISGSSVANVNFTASSTSTVFFFDDFTGNSLSSNWTVISRHGEYAQFETECNIPQQVSIANSILTITTDVGPATCGDFNIDGSVRHSPSSFPYITGDIQWAPNKGLSFTYGTVEYRAKFPPQNTGVWPAVWLLGANCQVTNVFTADTGYDTCPAIFTQGYVEIDATECDLDNWCQVLYFSQKSNTPKCPYPVDNNWHKFDLIWTANSISLTVDDKSTGCSFDNSDPSIPIPSTPMFLLIQTQTGGAGGTPTNALLPTQFQVDYVKVTQP